MGYCFMDIQKIKDFRSMDMKFQHNYRTKDVPNAIPELRQNNDELIRLSDQPGNPENYKEAFLNRIRSLEYYKSHNYRSDAVLALEVLTTFTKDNGVDLEQWKKDNVQWLRETFNQAPEKYGDNVLSVMYHGDEYGNVHCHAFVVPINAEGRLNSHSYYGGRASLSRLQDSYAKAMEAHGLERGVKGSSAKHQDIPKFYAKLNQRMDIPRPETGESASDFRHRIEQMIQTERAAMFRELDQKERAYRQKADKTIERERNALIGAAKAEKKHMEAELSTIRKELEQVSREKEILIHDCRKLKKQLSVDQKQHEQLQEQVHSLSQSISSLEVIKKKALSYDQQKALLEYTALERPDLAKNYEQVMSDIQEAFLEKYDMNR